MAEHADPFKAHMFRGNPLGLVNHALRNGRNVILNGGTIDEGSSAYKATLSEGSELGIDTTPAPRAPAFDHLGALALPSPSQPHMNHNRQGV